METVHKFVLRYVEMTSRFIEEVSYEDNNDDESICDIFDIFLKEIGKNSSAWAVKQSGAPSDKEQIKTSCMARS